MEDFNKLDRLIFSVNYGFEFDLLFPGILKKLNLSLFPSFVSVFFKDLVKKVIVERNGKPTNRRDFMDLILEMRNKQELKVIKRFDEEKDMSLEITDSIIEAQAFLFYAAGYETSASTLTFLLYQLALEPEIQGKLRAEIDNYLKQNNNRILLETLLKDLPYLEQVFNETLRKYPIVDFLQRSAVEEYELPETNLKLAKNQVVLISTYGIHHDEKYYPNPTKFDPERFTPDEIAARHPCAYLPFGVGPRHCIGK